MASINLNSFWLLRSAGIIVGEWALNRSLISVDKEAEIGGASKAFFH